MTSSNWLKDAAYYSEYIRATAAAQAHGIEARVRIPDIDTVGEILMKRLEKIENADDTLVIQTALAELNRTSPQFFRKTLKFETDPARAFAISTRIVAIGDAQGPYSIAARLRDDWFGEACAMIDFESGGVATSDENLLTALIRFERRSPKAFISAPIAYLNSLSQETT